MMSYLWILLLGSLLATSARAQEEEVAPDTPAPEAAAAPEVNAELDRTAEEVQPSASAPESDAESEAGAEQTTAPAAEDTEPAAPAADDAELPAPTTDDAEPATPAAPAAEDTEAATPAAPAAEDTEAATPAAPAAEDTEAAAPAAGDAEETTPAAEDAEATTPAAPAAGDAEEATSAANDTEADAAAATPEPEADPEVKDPEAEQPTVKVEEESTAGSDTTAAPVASGPDDEATDIAVEDNQEQPTDPATDAKPDVVEENILPEARPPRVRAFIPSDKEAPVKAAPVAGTQEDDKPQAQEGSSSALTGILCGIAVAAVGSVVGYVTYQKKKLCFKNRQEADPEAGRKADAAEANADPQVLSNLLNSS